MSRLDFLRAAAASSTDECIEWPWGTQSKRWPYGRITFDGRVQNATHVVLTLAGQPRPHVGDYFGACALHSCDNPRCVNARHLRWGTQAENMADRSARNRAPLGSVHGKSKLTEDDVRQIRCRCEAGESRRTVATDFGISTVNVGFIVNRNTWRHVA